MGSFPEILIDPSFFAPKPRGNRLATQVNKHVTACITLSGNLAEIRGNANEIKKAM